MESFSRLSFLLSSERARKISPSPSPPSPSSPSPPSSSIKEVIQQLAEKEIEGKKNKGTQNEQVSYESAYDIAYEFVCDVISSLLEYHHERLDLLRLGYSPPFSFSVSSVR
jgi:hypothetical protein